MNTLSIHIEAMDAKHPGHALAAFTVAQWSAAASTMKTMSHQTIQAMPYSLIAFDAHTHEVVGHIAITQLADGHGMLGGLVSNKPGNQVATKMTTHLLETAQLVLPDLVTCHAYANNKGVAFFERLGGTVLGPRGEDPYQTGCTNVIDMTPAIRFHGPKGTA
jgi:hypothetical protein